MKTVLPYPVLTGEVITEITRIQLDGAELPAGRIDVDRRTVDLSGVDDGNWQTLTVGVLVKGPIGDLTASGSPWTDVHAVGIVQSRFTDYRAAPTLSVDPGRLQRWTGSIDVARSEVFGTVTVSGVVTATVDGVSHRRVGVDEDDWQISLDDISAPPPGDALAMAWEDFKDPSDPIGLAVLKQNSALPTLLDIRASPTLYLNRGFTGLEGLLSASRQSKAEQALRDAVRTFIASQTWMSLFVETIQHVSIDETTDEIEWPAEEWRRSVLRTVVAHVHGVADDASLRTVYEEFNNPDSVGVVLQQVHVACSEVGRTPRLLASAISEISKEEGS